MFAVVPVCGALLILATYALGSRLSPRVGVASALLVAASPVFLYQVVQPMSDVPAAALCVVAVACATGTKRHQAGFAGLATSGAILMRPNLVPIGVVIGLFVLFRPERSWAQRIRAAVAYAAWSAPGCIAVALIQQAFYGSPFASGYGSYEAIFSVTHIGPNLARYSWWLWSVQTPAILLAVLAVFLLPGTLTTLLLALFLVNVALYLPYIVFNDWSYLRFLLPTIPFLLVLVAGVLDAIIGRVLRSGLSPADPRERRRAALSLGVMVTLLAIVFVQQARTLHAFDLRAMEARFALAGRYVARRLPANAMVITDYESGSVPFYSGRRALAWRSLDPAWLDRAVTFVRDQGFEPYLMFERWEEPEFRSRFARSSLGPLDWPPIAEVATQVRIYRVADRDRYWDGQSVPTEYVR
jgi:multidrug transporter EmrE-like cation transporter